MRHALSRGVPLLYQPSVAFSHGVMCPQKFRGGLFSRRDCSPTGDLESNSGPRLDECQREARSSFAGTRRRCAQTSRGLRSVQIGRGGTSRWTLAPARCRDIEQEAEVSRIGASKLACMAVGYTIRNATLGPPVKSRSADGGQCWTSLSRQRVTILRTLTA